MYAINPPLLFSEGNTFSWEIIAGISCCRVTFHIDLHEGGCKHIEMDGQTDALKYIYVHIYTENPMTTKIF